MKYSSFAGAALSMNRKISFSILLGLAFVRTAQAVDLENAIARLPEGAKVGVYTGSFDPLHLGHEKAIEASLRRLDYVFAYADDQHNPYKPFRTPWKWRTLGVGKLFESNPRVITTDKKFLEAMKVLGEKKVRVTKILGSDNFVRRYPQGLSGKPMIGDEENWFIIWRDTELKQEKYASFREVSSLSANRLGFEPNSGEAKAVVGIQHVYLDPQFSGFSSTLVRSSSEADSKNYLSPVIASWMKSFPFYKKFTPALTAESIVFQASEDSALSPKIKFCFEAQVKANITVLLAEKGIVLPAGSEIISGDALGVQGVSGNQIYMVRDAEKKVLYVAKVFVTDERVQQFKNEKASLIKLAELGLKESSVIREIASSDYLTEGGNPYSVLVLSTAIGQSVEKYVADLNAAKGAERIQALSTLEGILAQTGKALAELHSIRATAPIQLTGEALRELTKDFDSVFAKIEESQRLGDGIYPASLKVDELKKAVAVVTQNFEKSSGYLSLNHGDANANNFFYDLATGTFTWIDAGTVMRYLKADLPIGYPARDYYQFVSSFYLNIGSKGYSFTHEEIQKLQTAFESGYDGYLAKVGKQVSPESKKFFQMAWALKGMRFDHQFLQFEVNPAQIRFLKSDIERCIRDILVGEF